MSLRIERLKEVIREESAETITQDLSDPRLGFCTVTKIELTNDLAYCTVHVSVIGDDSVKSKTMHALKAARGLIQAKIAKRLKTRTTPHVDIALDESMEKAFGVLEKIKEARATDSDGGKNLEEPVEPDSDAEADDEEDEAPKPYKRKPRK
jgi:ribosome-binding factor A